MLASHVITVGDYCRREALRISHPGGNFYQRQRRKGQWQQLNDHHIISLVVVYAGLLYKMKKKKKVFYTSQIGSEG